VALVDRCVANSTTESLPAGNYERRTALSHEYRPGSVHGDDLGYSSWYCTSFPDDFKPRTRSTLELCSLGLQPLPGAASQRPYPEQLPQPQEPSLVDWRVPSVLFANNDMPASINDSGDRRVDVPNGQDSGLLPEPTTSCETTPRRYW
jgi:hypothetical protein